MCFVLPPFMPILDNPESLARAGDYTCLTAGIAFLSLSFSLSMSFFTSGFGTLKAVTNSYGQSKVIYD
jgi:hypothetical protein